MCGHATPSEGATNPMCDSPRGCSFNESPRHQHQSTRPHMPFELKTRLEFVGTVRLDFWNIPQI